MTTDQLANDAVWGAPDPSPRGWGIRETAVAVGVAAVIAGLGGAAIYAATEGNTHSMGGSHQPFGRPGGQHSGPCGAIAGPRTFGQPSPLHGEYVVPDGSGGYATELSQTGTVTEISPSSITVRSEDGFTATYAIAQTSAAPFVVDEQVSVRATRTGQTAAATSIDKPADDGGPGGPGGPPHR